MRKTLVSLILLMFALLWLMAPGCGKGAKESAPAAGSTPAMASPEPASASTPATSTPPVQPAAGTVAVTEYLDLFEGYSQKYFLESHLKLEQKYGKKVTFNTIPLVGNHKGDELKRSHDAAASALCAKQQGKYYEYLTVWFKDKFMNLKDSDFADAADQVKLNIPIFNACVKKSNWDTALGDNLQKAKGIGVRSVPTVFVGDTPLLGQHDLADYSKLVDRYLGASQGTDKDLTLTVLYDDQCAYCDDKPSVNMIVQAFALTGAFVKRVSLPSTEGQVLLKQSKTKFLPRMFFNKAIEEARAFSGLQKNMEKVGDLYLYDSQAGGGVTRWLEPPKLPERHVKGDSKASVTVYEFLDFQCPACGAFFALKFPELNDKYVKTGQVRWVAIQFPLQVHEHAYDAAVASECASDQGKFWEYHDLLFQNQRNLERNDLIQYASRVTGMKVEPFTSCLSRTDITQRVASDQKLGQALGNPGTPTLFIGPYSMGGLDLAELERVIDGEIARAKGKN